VIVSHRHKFIFVKGIKVAGTSFEAAMYEYCGPNDIITKISSNEATDTDKVEPVAQNDKGFSNHMSAERIKKRFGDIWDEYLKLTIVRNPWDIAVSYYFWSLHNQAFGPNEPIERLFFNPMLYAKGLDLYLRFESLQADFDAFLERLGLPPKKLPRLKDKCRPVVTYREFFDQYPEARHNIGETTKEYCERFGYTY
jgi:hypothetical protein